MYGYMLVSLEGKWLGLDWMGGVFFEIAKLANSGLKVDKSMSPQVWDRLVDLEKRGGGFLKHNTKKI